MQAALSDVGVQGEPWAIAAADRLQKPLRDAARPTPLAVANATGVRAAHAAGKKDIQDACWEMEAATAVLDKAGERLTVAEATVGTLEAEIRAMELEDKERPWGFWRQAPPSPNGVSSAIA